MTDSSSLLTAGGSRTLRELWQRDAEARIEHETFVDEGWAAGDKGAERLAVLRAAYEEAHGIFLTALSDCRPAGGGAGRGDGGHLSLPLSLPFVRDAEGSTDAAVCAVSGEHDESRHAAPRAGARAVA